MTFEAFLDYLKPFKGTEFDFLKKRGTIHFAGIKIGPFPLGRIKLIGKNPHFLEELLSECFLKRRAMWEPSHREGSPEYVESSMVELSKVCKSAIKKLEKSDAREDAWAAGLVRHIDNQATKCKKRLHQWQQDNPQTEFSWDCRDHLGKILYGFRASVYPVIRDIASLLPSASGIRSETLSTIDQRTPEILELTGRTTLQEVTWEID